MGSAQRLIGLPGHDISDGLIIQMTENGSSVFPQNHAARDNGGIVAVQAPGSKLQKF